MCFFLYLIICQPWSCLLPPKTCSDIPGVFPPRIFVFLLPHKYSFLESLLVRMNKHKCACIVHKFQMCTSFLSEKPFSPLCKIITHHSTLSFPFPLTLLHFFSHIPSSYIICYLSSLYLLIECKLHQKRTFIFIPLSPEHCLAWHSDISWSNEWTNAKHILAYLVVQK